MKQQDSNYRKRPKQKARTPNMLKKWKSERFLTCEECGGKVVKKKVPFKHLGITLGKFEAEVCTKCGETVFSMKEGQKIEEKAKEKGVWGLSSKTKVGVSGNSLDVRIDKKIAEFLNLEKGKEVTLQPEGKDKLVMYL